MKLSFHEKAKISEAICARYGKPWFAEYLWPTITSLNTARNDLAHNLEPAKLDRLLQELTSIHDKVRTLALKELGEVVPSKPSYFTPPVVVRLLVIWCLGQLDELISATFASEIAFVRFFALEGGKIIERSLDNLNELKMQDLRPRMEKDLLGILKFLENTNDNETVGILDQEIPDWRDHLERLSSLYPGR